MVLSATFYSFSFLCTVFPVNVREINLLFSAVNMFKIYLQFLGL